MTRASLLTRWRRWVGAAQAALFLGLPFVRVKGESALRLDVPAGRLHAFGASFTIAEAFVVLTVVLLATFAFLLATLLLGRVFCGWSCPQTVLCDLTAWVVSPRRARPDRLHRALGFLAVAFVSALFSAAFLSYFVPPRRFFERLAQGQLGAVLSISWAVLTFLLFADLSFLRQVFCATVCPYAKLQGVLFDEESLIIAYDAGRAAECVDCGACVRVCPTGIDIRRGLQMQCIACAACIDACGPVMRKLGRAPHLVGYFLGDPGRPRPRSRWRLLLRPGVLALAAGTVLCGVLLAVVLAERAPLELEAFLEEPSARRTADGRTVNILMVELENRTRSPVTVALSFAPVAAKGSLGVSPEKVELGPLERRHLRARVTADGLSPGRTRARLQGEVREGDRLLGRQDAEVSLVVPEAP